MSKNLYYDVVQATSKQIQEIEQEVAGLIDRNPKGDYRALGWQGRTLRAVSTLANMLYLADLDHQGKPESPSTRAKRASNEYLQQFIDALGNGLTVRTASINRAEEYRLLLDALTETGGTPAGEEGGFLSPLFFDGLVHEQLRQYLDLAEFTTVQDVTSFKGWRTVEAEGGTPAEELTQVAENTGIEDEAEAPVFSKIEYELVGYKGILPVSTDLWKDTPVNILAYLSRWWAKKVALRNNILILALIDALTPASTAADGPELMAAIRTALNKTLDPAIVGGAAIFCNQTAYDLLDQMTDGSGRPVIQPDGSLLRRPIVMVADRLWPNDTEGGVSNVAVGSLAELVTYFRRGMFELASTTESKTAWRNSNTEVRAILRVDPRPVDTSAVVVIPVTLPA